MACVDQLRLHLSLHHSTQTYGGLEYIGEWFRHQGILATVYSRKLSSLQDKNDYKMIACCGALHYFPILIEMKLEHSL